VPDRGAIFGGDTNAVSAYANGHLNPPDPNSHARIDMQCDSWTNFHGNSSAGYVATGWLAWASTGALQYVSGVQPLASADNVCFLTGLDSLSVTGEMAQLAIPSGSYTWQLEASGFRALSAGARCVSLGRPISNYQWLDTASNPYSTLSPYAGVCLIYNVTDNIDDGGVRITGNPMRLEISGGVTRAKAACFPY
jgi:hypothetical protein